jgi:hypothetical protein
LAEPHRALRAATELLYDLLPVLPQPLHDALVHRIIVLHNRNNGSDELSATAAGVD